MSATTAPPRRSVRKRPTAGTATPEPRTRGRTDDGGSTGDGRAGGGSRLSSLPFLGLVAILLGGGLLTLLMVNNSLAAGSFEQARLRAEQTRLFEQEQALRQDVQRLSSPTRLRAEARKLGLVAAATTAYLDLSSGTILGDPMPSGGTMVTDPDSGPAVRSRDSLVARLEESRGDGTTVTAPPGVDSAQPQTLDHEPGGDGASVTVRPRGGDTAYDRAVVTGGGR